MKTVDGHTIKLDQETLGPDPERAKKLMVFGPSFFPILFVLLPLYILADTLGVGNAGIIVLSVAACVFIAMTVYLKRLMDAEDPAIQHKGPLVFIHFRILFTSAILFFLCAKLSLVLIGAVVVVWLSAEVHHFFTLNRVEDSAICAAYPVRFSKLDSGDWLYNSRTKVDGVIKEPWYYSKAAEAFLIPILMVVGGFVYMRSFTLRDNFEPRFILGGCVGLFLAVLVRSFITRSALEVRMVKLKAEGKF